MALGVITGVRRVITFADVAKSYWFALCGSSKWANANIRLKPASTSPDLPPASYTHILRFLLLFDSGETGGKAKEKRKKIEFEGSSPLCHTWRSGLRCHGSQLTPTLKKARDCHGVSRSRRSPPRMRTEIIRYTDRMAIFYLGVRIAGLTSILTVNLNSGLGIALSVEPSTASHLRPLLDTLSLSHVRR